MLVQIHYVPLSDLPCCLPLSLPCDYADQESENVELTRYELQDNYFRALVPTNIFNINIDQYSLSVGTPRRFPLPSSLAFCP